MNIVREQKLEVVECNPQHKRQLIHYILNVSVLPCGEKGMHMQFTCFASSRCALIFVGAGRPAATGRAP
jgi:hypothetical protein